MRALLTGWRIINMALLVVGFLGPWVPDGCSETETLSGVFITRFTFTYFVESPADFLVHGFPFQFLLVGLICIFCYMAVNLIAIVLRRQPLKRRALGILFAAALVGILVPAIQQIESTGTFSSLLWGYMLVWVGLLSSMVLETGVADMVNDMDPVGECIAVGCLLSLGLICVSLYVLFQSGPLNP